MNPPLVDAQRFLWACLMGAGLGLLYGMLRPIRQKHPHIADILVILAAFWCWLQLSFAICRGDLRFAYTSGLFFGALGEELTLGRLLMPVFFKIHSLIADIFSFLLLPWKNFFKKCRIFVNFLFATGKKWGTINCNLIRTHRETLEAPPMSNRIHPFTRIRLVYRRSSPLLKCAVLAGLILSTVAILAVLFFLRQNQQQTETLRGHAARLEQENQQLVQDIQQVGTVESIKRIAQEELDLVDPEAEFFRPVEDNPES